MADGQGNPFWGAFKDLFTPTSDAQKAAMLAGLFGTGSSVLDAIASGKRAGAELDLAKGQNLADVYTNAEQMRQRIYGDALDQAQRGGATALTAIGGPMDLFDARSSAAAKRGFVEQGGLKPPAGSPVRMPDLSGMFSSMKPFVSEEAQLASETPFWQGISLATQGRMGAGDLSQGGYTPRLAAPVSTQLGAYQNQALQEALDTRKQAQQSINQAQTLSAQALKQSLQADQQKKKSGGFWSKLGGVLKFAAPIAASFIPGLNAVTAPLLAAGGTIAGSKMQGEGWGSALGQGAIAGLGTKAKKTQAKGGGLPGQGVPAPGPWSTPAPSVGSVGFPLPGQPGWGVYSPNPYGSAFYGGGSR